MSLQETPRGNRLHIGIYGKRNSGKSSLINAITGHETALVSEFAGTTTDPVFKSMEIHGIGPCVLIDTAGFDDQGSIGELRVEMTRKAMDKTDIALIVFDDGPILVQEKDWLAQLRLRQIPAIPLLNKGDLLSDPNRVIQRIEAETGIRPILVSAKERTGIGQIRASILRHLPEDFDHKSITGDLVKDGDLVLLVMPQDIQAPKGRLILPQVQTLRELLDKHCLVMSTTTDKLDEALAAMARAPELIITDSQVFRTVYDLKPAESRLTSFSVLFAGHKGDIGYYASSAAVIETLTEQSRVLIAEACTHAPLTEDIGREKIPALLRKKIGPGLAIDMVSGSDFPEDLTRYDLVIQCGACMFNRKMVLSRIEKAVSQGVPMSNYGVVMAHLSGILDKISTA